jgi:uncharacterized membrane protein YheB (UPF0754 family)
MRWSVLVELLPWILTPFLGAVIGYVTNAVAIRMLFRPLAEKHLFGIRIPLTPGVIPKQRYILAESIGRMVSERLITEDALERQISSKEFQTGLWKNVSELTDRLFTTPLSRLSRDNLPVLYSSLQSFISELLFAFINSRSFIYAVRNLATQLVQSVAEMRIEELIRTEEAIDFIETRIYPNILNGRAQRWAYARMREWINGHINRNTTLGDLVPQELFEIGFGAIETLLPDLLASVLSWLRGDDARRELESRGRILLRDVLDKLNLLQKFFVSVAQYDRVLDEKMPEIVDEALDSIENSLTEPEVQHKIARALKLGIKDWAEKGMFDIVYSTGFNVDERIGSLVNHIFEYLKSPVAKQRIENALGSFLESQRHKSVRAVIGAYLSIGENEIVDFTSTQILSFLSKPGTSDVLSDRIISIATGFLEDRRDTTVGELLRIDPGKKDRLDSYLAETFSQILKERLPYLVESFNIRQLVVDKINQLDVAQVESLLLMVISKHLKWINIFGALLGALIGLSQVLLRLLHLV